MNPIRLYLLKRKLEKNLALRRKIRKARSESSHKGVSTEWARRGAKCREMFGGMM